MKSEKRSFFFHYNKPASQQAGEPRLSLHWKDRCEIVTAIDCRVPVRTRNRKTQPRCVMAGKATFVIFIGTHAHIS